MDKQELYKKIVDRAREETIGFSPLEQELAVRFYTYGATSEVSEAYHTEKMYSEKTVRMIIDAVMLVKVFTEEERKRVYDWFNENKK